MHEGRHKAHAIDMDFGFASTGTEQIAIAFEIIEGDCVGDTINWYGFFTDKAAERTLKTLRDLGWAGDDLSKLEITHLVNEVNLVVQSEQDQNGEVRLRVAFVNALGSGNVGLKNRMNPQQKLAFAQRMRGLCMATVPAPSQKPAQQTRPAASTPQPPAVKPNGKPQPMPSTDLPPDDVDDDELPF